MAIFFGTGNDDQMGGSGDGSDDQIHGLGGNDGITDNLGNNQLFGGADHDNLATGDGNDTLYGGSGNDYLTGGGADDLIHGGIGNDFVWIFNGDGNTHGGGDQVYGEAGNDGFRLDEYGASTGTMLDGGSGFDFVDIKLGGFYRPGNELDRSSYYVDLTDVWGGGIGIVGGSTITGIEAIKNIQGGAGDDTIIIGAGYQTEVDDPNHPGIALNGLHGGEGNDYISGGSARETLDGDAGNDSLLGNRGEDNLFGGGGNDLMNAGTGHDQASGGDGDDTLLGEAGNDTLYAQDGDDLMDGGTGDDLMDGGAGNDTYVIDSLNDRVSDGGGTDTVMARVNLSLDVWPLSVSIEHLTLTGAAVSGTGNGLANVLTGNLGDNQLAGLAGNDTLIGDGGADLLAGGLGADRLVGGGGADSFVFDVLEVSANADRIVGFVHGTDKIVIDHTVFGAFAAGAPGPVDPLAFGLGGRATTPDQHLIFKGTTGALLYDADGRGGAAAILLAVLAGGAVLDATDIFLL